MRILVIALAALLSAAACAQSTQSETAPIVDLEQVKRSGTVQPVNGLTTAGQPDEAAFKVFATEGYTTVIDLRAVDEDRGLDEAAVVSALGMNYINLPIDSLESISFESAQQLDRLMANADGPVLLHCASSNRVGALLALSESLKGADNDAALVFGREAGMTSLEDRVKELLQKK